MVRTKIICTVGPATESYEMLHKLYNAGMSIVRLNMSHGNHESHAQVIKRIRSLNRKLPFPLATLLDTQGPEIRTGDLINDLNLKKGDIVTIAARDGVDVEEASIHINYADLTQSVGIGDRITVDNGLMNFQVLEKQGRLMKCKVIDGGILKSKRHVNLPGIRVNLPAITLKDEKDILFGIEQGVDFIALSFVREARDVLDLRERLASKGQRIQIIAKIEDQEGYANLEQILEVSDGIMVARGDLGVEMDIHDLPSAQRHIVKRCGHYGKRVIVATHLLESMITNPLPTRAEVTDVANAVFEEVDAVMLSGETTVGKYPVQCVEQLVRIIAKTETMPGIGLAKELRPDNDRQHMAHAAVQLAESLPAKGIVVVTRRGIMANYVANCRPLNPMIYGFTNVSQTRRGMNLNRGVLPFRITFSTDPEKTLMTAFNLLKERQGFSTGDTVVVISDVLAGVDKVPAIQIRKIP